MKCLSMNVFVMNYIYMFNNFYDSFLNSYEYNPKCFIKIYSYVIVAFRGVSRGSSIQNPKGNPKDEGS